MLGVLAIPVGPPQSDSPLPLPVGSLDIDIRNVGFTYQTREVGDRGSFEVPALVGVNAWIAFGSRIAVVGETGSGKTTFGRLLGRFSDPTIGGITLGGVDLTMVANDELRKRVVIVPQEPFLLMTRSEITFASSVRRSVISNYVMFLGRSDLKIG